MNYKILVAMIALPMSLSPLLSKPAAAELTQKFAAKQSSTLVADRYDDWRRDRRDELLREERRERRWERRDYNRGYNYDRRVWVPGYYTSSFLGLGRRWVPGHWEYR